MRVRVKIIESGYPVFLTLLLNAKNSPSRPRTHMSDWANPAVRIETGDLRWKRNATSPWLLLSPAIERSCNCSYDIMISSNLNA